MLTILLIAQLLTPSEAAAVMERLVSPSNMTHYRVPPPEPYPRPPVVIVKPAAPAKPQVVLRPLNCCDRYVIRVPRERRHR